MNGVPSVTKDSDSVTLDISFTNDLPRVGYKANTIYEHWNVTLQGNDTQANANGGFFHRGYGLRLTFLGEFRHFGDHVRGFGVSYSMNSGGGGFTTGF